MVESLKVLVVGATGNQVVQSRASSSGRATRCVG